MAFFMGVLPLTTRGKHLQSRIDYENEIYNDIVQEDYIDSYRNMTYKAISAARWITKHCTQAKLIIKADDDALLDLPCMMKQIKELQQNGSTVNASLYCQ